MSLQPELAAMARLRFDTQARGPGYPGLASGLARIQQLYGRVQAEGQWQAWAPGGQVRAGCSLLHDPAPPTVHPITWLLLDSDGTPAAQAWLAEALDGLALPDDLYVFVPAPDRWQLDLLLGRGLGIQHLVLAGRVEEAWERLVAHGLPSATLDGPGLELVPLHAFHLDAAVALYREVFEALPRFCPFGTDPGWLARFRARLADPTGGTRLVLLHHGRVRGVFNADHTLDDPHHGRSGGIGLVLAPELHGRGVSGPVYRRLLEGLRAAHIGWIKGTTAQPPVMRMARRMGRHVTGVGLGVGHPFPPGWFDPMLQPAG